MNMEEIANIQEAVSAVLMIVIAFVTKKTRTVKVPVVIVEELEKLRARQQTT